MTVPGSDPGRRKRLKALREAALHRPVLARHLSDGFNGRWSRKQWVTASLFASMGLLVAAIVPGFNADITAPVKMPRQSMALPLPPLPARPAAEARGDSWQVVTVQSGQTLGQLFEEQGIPAALLQRILEQPSAKQALGRLRPGTELAFDLPVEGNGLRTFRFDRDDTHRIELAINGDQIVEKVIERPVETRTVVTTGEITSSLYAAARKAGLSPAAIAVMTDQIFQYDIDFNTDIQRGDRFSVVMDETWREGERIGRGTIRAATFTTGNKTHSGFRFERGDKAEYFTADGRPLKKSFIRMPIPYARLTSGFGSRRHPVLGKVRQHKGVDYGAKTGTPIMAAGEARVKFAGWQNGYGRTVILDHGRGYTTLYAHMSRLGKYTVGQRVPQGAVIGYVGASGLATGPHLHYEFRVNGVHRNPLSVTMPPPEPLRGQALAEFRAQTGPALARIQQVERIIYADAGGNADDKNVAAAKPAGGKKG